MEEIWKQLVYPGFPTENHFIISSWGRVKNSSTGNILKQHLLRSGYYSVRVWVGSQKKKRHILAHRAVAYAFLENPNGYIVINNLDGDKTNNHVENLEWCTYGHNLQHSYNSGLFDRAKISGEKNHASKLTWDDVKFIREKYANTDCTQRSLVDEFGVSRQVINSVIQNKTWKDSTYSPPKPKSDGQSHRALKNNKSGHVGVMKVKNRNLYRAALMYHGVRYDLGCYKIFEDACKAYDNKLKDLTK